MTVQPEDRKEETLPDAFQLIIPGVDFDSGLKKVGGNKRLYAKLLSEFVRDYKDVPEKIKNLLEKKDIETAGRISHTMKGLTGTLGAGDLQSRFTELESAINKNKEAVGHQVKELTIAFEKIVSQIADAFPIDNGHESEISEISADMVDKKEVMSLLCELKGLVKISDMEAEDLLKSFYGKLAALLPDDAKGLSDAIGAIDFNKAGAIIASAISEIETLIKKESQ